MKDQRNNHKSNTVKRVGARLLQIALIMGLISDSSSGFNQVQGANTDKVSFNIFEIDNKLIDILWCGNTNEVILVQTDSGTIYRSRDKGDSWKKLRSMMKQSGAGVLDEG